MFQICFVFITKVVIYGIKCLDYTSFELFSIIIMMNFPLYFRVYAHFQYIFLYLYIENEFHGFLPCGLCYFSCCSHLILHFYHFWSFYWFNLRSYFIYNVKSNDCDHTGSTWLYHLNVYFQYTSISICNIKFTDST